MTFVSRISEISIVISCIVGLRQSSSGKEAPVLQLTLKLGCLPATS